MADNKALVRSLEKSLQVNSLKDLVRAKTSEIVFLVLDCSGSMDAWMASASMTRIMGLRKAVSSIQSQKPTTMIAFGPPNSDFMPAYFVEPEAIPNPGNGTPLHSAIDYAAANGAGRLIVISDGQPDNARMAMESAAKFGGKIDVIFVGDPGDPGSIFLEELAASTGGSRFEGDLGETKEIAGTVVALLNGEVLEQDDDEDDEDDDDEDLDEEDEE